jgi:phosphatidylinositol-4,5-bisphosphate 3-kinase
VCRFKSLCEKAYMALRQQSHILLVLFLMMVNTGIPELSSLKDSTRGVRFLLTTLLPQESEEKARVHWNAKLTEALNKSFWSSLNNAFHLIRNS